MKVSTNLEIKRTYSVNGVEYNTKEEAKQALAMEILQKHLPSSVIDEAIENAEDLIQALRVFVKK